MTRESNSARQSMMMYRPPTPACTPMHQTVKHSEKIVHFLYKILLSLKHEHCLKI